MGRALVAGVLLAGLIGPVAPAAVAQSTVVLGGTVRDGAATPLAGAEVRVVAAGTATVVGSATTGAAGGYSMTIPPGTYDVTAIPPSGSGLQPATILHRSILADSTIDFVLVAAGSATLAGRVVDKAGVGVGGQSVTLAAAGGGPASTVATAADGSYGFTVAPGDYQLTIEGAANPPGLAVPQSYRLSRHSPVLSLTGNTTLDVPLPAHRVTVHVQDGAGAPVAGVDVTATNPFGGGFCCSFLTVAGLTFEVGWSFHHNPTTTDADGDAVLYLFPGPSGGTTPYTFTATPPAGFLPFSIDVPVTGDRTVVISLQPADSTPPLVTGVPDRPPNAAGWYAGDVLVDWAASDPDPSSGTPTDPPDTLATLEGTHVYTSGQSCDPAGNCATGSIELSIDETPPVAGPLELAGSPRTQAESTVVSVAVADAVSGVAGGELFRGDDPGAGAATPMALSGSTLNATLGAEVPVGVHRVGARARDRAGNWSEASIAFLVVFDAAGRRIVGSGEAGHEVEFGFSIRTDSAGAARGEFELEDGDLELFATVVDRLWIFTDWAHAAGQGRLDDGPAVEWQLTVVDGRLSQPGGPDLIRVKVWKAGAPALVLYDTQPGAGELDRPALRVVDGAIRIRKA